MVLKVFLKKRIEHLEKKHSTIFLNELLQEEVESALALRYKRIGRHGLQTSEINLWTEEEIIFEI